MKELRVYALTDLESELITDEIFIDEAEGMGYVWSIQGFVDAFNNGQVSDQWIIRII